MFLRSWMHCFLNYFIRSITLSVLSNIADTPLWSVGWQPLQTIVQIFKNKMIEKIVRQIIFFTPISECKIKHFKYCWFKSEETSQVTRPLHQKFKSISACKITWIIFYLNFQVLLYSSLEMIPCYCIFEQFCARCKKDFFQV